VPGFHVLCLRHWSHGKVGAVDLNEFPREAWPPSVMDVTKKSTLLHFGNRDSAVSL